MFNWGTIMKVCPKCKEQHSKSGVFCSRSCANSRNWSDDEKLKRSIALKGKACRPKNFNQEEWRTKIRATRLKKYMETPFNDLGMENRRRRVFEEQNFKCSKCGISEWLGQPLILELEHKDGNNQNNSRENLEALCPNCHSLTETWRGRNKPRFNGNKIVSDEVLLEQLKTQPNIRQALLSCGIAAKGKNYSRAKKLLDINSAVADW